MRRARAVFIGLLLSWALPALAVPTTVTHTSGGCDPLFVPTAVDELGLPPSQGGPFPADEAILTNALAPNQPAVCPATAQGGYTIEILIGNLTSTSFDHVWYVADPETTVTNYDGTVNGMLAFEIDAVGANTPLVYEDVVDGIFSPVRPGSSSSRTTPTRATRRRRSTHRSGSRRRPAVRSTDPPAASSRRRFRSQGR